MPQPSAETSGLVQPEAAGRSKEAANPRGAEGETQATELARHGITSVPVTFFDWGGYRYSNARDAIAAAKRGERK